MPDVSPARHTPPDLPARWPRLLLLGVGVLALHLLLLTDGWPGFTSPAAATLEAAPPVAQTPDEATRPGEAAAPANPPPARISTVRWIVPTPVAASMAPEPARQAAPPAKPPARVAAPRPVAPAAPAPMSAPMAEAPAPLPTEEVALAPAPPADAIILAQATPPAEPVPAVPPAGKPLPPARPPASIRLPYVVSGQAKGFHYNATGTLDWELDGGRYSARMEMRMPLLGSRVQTSTGAVGPEGLMPERFADKGRSEKAAHFERDAHRIRFSANTPEAELLPGAQDRLSLFLQIAGLLQARPQAYASGQVIDMQVAGTGDAEIWRFQVGEESTLALPAGELRVRHLVRQPRKEFDSTVEMWLAPELNHLPVRLKVTQANGDMADQQLSQKP